MHDKYLGLSPEEFAVLYKRNIDFQNSCDDLTKDPVKVFSPLTAKRLAEVALIREVSLELKKNKEEDMKKAAQKAEEAAEKSEEKTKDNAEETKPETEK